MAAALSSFAFSSSSGTGSKSVPGAAVGSLVLIVYSTDYDVGYFEEFTTFFERVISVADHIQQQIGLATGKDFTIFTLTP